MLQWQVNCSKSTNSVSQQECPREPFIFFSTPRCSDPVFVCLLWRAPFAAAWPVASPKSNFAVSQFRLQLFVFITWHLVGYLWHVVLTFKIKWRALTSLLRLLDRRQSTQIPFEAKTAFGRCKGSLLLALGTLRFCAFSVTHSLLDEVIYCQKPSTCC